MSPGLSAFTFWTPNMTRLLPFRAAGSEPQLLSVHESLDCSCEAAHVPGDRRNGRLACFCLS